MVRVVANLRDLFAAHYAPGKAAVAAALRTGLVAPDTNVLLAAYRFERQARDELLNALAKLEDRLWIPYQVALEFHRNRLSVIAEQEAFFGKARKDLDAAVSSYLGKLGAFTNRIAMPQARVQELDLMIRGAHAHVLGQVTAAEEANEVHLDSHASDEVLARLEDLFGDGRVGEPMKPEELEAARKEAKRRVEQKIPPGYADKDKTDPSGDYLLWKQLMQEAGRRGVPIVLVSDDRKEDWVRREYGKTLGPRPELYEEMTAAARAPFHLMTTATFLRHAKEHLSVSVSPETVDQASELPDALRERELAALEMRLQDLTQDLDRAEAEFVRAQRELGESERRRIRDGDFNEEAQHEIRARLAEGEARRHLLQARREETARSLEALNRSREMR
jgi:hypothetical protein